MAFERLKRFLNAKVVLSIGWQPPEDPTPEAPTVPAAAIFGAAITPHQAVASALRSQEEHLAWLEDSLDSLTRQAMAKSKERHKVATAVANLRTWLEENPDG